MKRRGAKVGHTATPRHRSTRSRIVLSATSNEGSSTTIAVRSELEPWGSLTSRTATIRHHPLLCR